MYKVHNSRYYRFIIQQSNYQVNKLNYLHAPEAMLLILIFTLVRSKIFVGINKNVTYAVMFLE